MHDAAETVAEGDAPALRGRPCVVCGTPVQPRIEPWSARCPACGTWTSDLRPAIDERARPPVDEAVRQEGHEALRRAGFRRVLDEVDEVHALAGARLLDVGCARGWFLDEAEHAGASVVGVEPDAQVAAAARASGFDVRTGSFPDAVAGEGEGAFDLVTFNDVLEHIPGVRATLAACARLLRPGGHLILKIPNAEGLAYRTATRLARVGVRRPYEQLWQSRLSSPRLHYFTPPALARLVEEHGFAVVRDTRLPPVPRSGLWQRVHTLRRVSPGSVALYAATWCAAPVLNRQRASDILLLVAERRA